MRLRTAQDAGRLSWAPAMAAPPFDALYGLEIEAATAEGARGTVPVSDGVRQPAGLVHGGVYASMAESLAVAATEAATGPRRGRPLEPDELPAPDHRRHGPRDRPPAATRGRSTWVWEFDVTDDDGRLCALVRMTVARPRRVANVNGGWVREVERPALASGSLALAPSRSTLTDAHTANKCDTRVQPATLPLPHVPPPLPTPASPPDATGACNSSGRSPSPGTRLVIGIRRSRPNARGVILIPGGAWRRLYSARSTSASTRSTASSGRPARISCSRSASSSM